MGILADEDRDDQMGNEHANTTCEKDLSPAKSIQCPEAADNADQLDAVDNSGHDELHIEIQAHSGKQGRRIVDYH